MSFRVYFYSSQQKGHDHHITKAGTTDHLKDRQLAQMVAIIQRFKRGDLVVERQMKDRASKVLYILSTIACWAHWVYGSPKVMLELVEIQFTNPELREDNIFSGS